MKMCLAVLVLALSACVTNTGIVKIDDDTYMYAKQDWMAYSGSAVKVEMFKEANAFYKNMGKKMRIVGQQSQDYAYYTSSAAAEIQFQCV